MISNDQRIRHLDGVPHPCRIPPLRQLTVLLGLLHCQLGQHDPLSGILEILKGLLHIKPDALPDVLLIRPCHLQVGPGLFHLGLASENR